nr:MAG TPA: Extracellular arabinanase, arabinanase, arabinotriose, Geobacillus stearothermophilus [Caudoviricetes sp.]
MMAAIKLVNLCQDSSFENKSFTFSTNYVYNTDISLGGNVSLATKKATTSNVFNFPPSNDYIITPVVENHIFYIACHSPNFASSVSLSYSIGSWYLSGDTNINYNINNAWYKNILKEKIWYRHSRIATISTSTTMKLSISINMATSSIIYLDDIILIDLTESFGAGNEPTREWCDENIPYFEDSYTLAEGSIIIKNHQGEWVKAKKVYQKTSDGWSEITNKYTINDLFSKTKHIDVDYHEKKQSDTFLGHCRALIRPNNAGTSPVDVSKYNQTLSITTPSISTFASPLSDGNKTFSFTSTNNAIAINNVSTLPKFATDDWTIDWWEYRQDTTTSSSFKMGPTKGTSFMGCYQVGTNLCFYATRKGSSWDVLNGAIGSAVTRNTWVHHAIVRHKSDLLVFKNGTLVKTLKEVSDFIAASYFTISSNSSTPSITGNMDEFRISDFAVWTSDFTPKTTRYLNNGEEYDSLPRGDADDEFVLLGKEFKDDSLHGHEVTNVGCSIMAPT